MKEIVPGVFGWSVYNQEKEMNFNGWHLKAGDEAVVIDPVTPSEKVLSEIQAKGEPKVVLLTNKDHTRASEIFRKKFDSAVWVPELDKKRMEIPIDRTFRESDRLPCNLQAISIPDQKTEGETAFLFPGPVRTLILGDALWGKPAGSLRMLPPQKYQRLDLALKGLAILVDHDFEAILVGDGEPILHQAKKALKDFLKRAEKELN